MEEASGTSDEFMIWVKDPRMRYLRRDSILWRVKNSSRMAEDPNRKIITRGHVIAMKKKEAFNTLGPVILEILFSGNPLNELVAALKENSANAVREFLSDLRYLLVSETDVQISDVAFLISHASLLSAFSFRSDQKGTSDEDFECLFPALSDAQIRLIDLNGSCPTKEMELVIRNLNIGLVRFHTYPGINVELFENTKAMNSAVEFIVAQGVHPGTDNAGLRFLKHLKNVFPAMKNIYWDWSMMMPTLTQLSDNAKTCLDQLVQLYKEMDMNLLAILFFMASEGSDETMNEVWAYLDQFDLPNAKMIKVLRDDKPHYHPPYMLFLAGTSEKIRRLQKVVCEDRIVEPDLRHFLYIQNRSIEVYKNDNIFEFLGFDFKRV
ncbi:hypothetical protein X798_04194 [Onchocerca flexuosa]|uniref:Uncharacterized protein n=1 Tax=Onchocerca flexuosa TaxID=387005 RepID=A0A238BVR1_9BILA|nr:hypothetical protein X798_04194 [Onchocerca flexuosa]